MTGSKKFKNYVNLSGWSKFMNRRIALCLIVTFLLTNLTTAATLYVPSGLNPTIEAAISNAGFNDTIIVADGNYTPLNPNGFDFGGKFIWLKSANGPQNCIIDCNNNRRAFYFHNGEIPAAKVDGFTIKNGNAYYGGAIECEEASPTIINCIIINSTAAFGGAIDIFHTSTVALQPVIKNCIIANNAADLDGAAIECSSGSSPDINNCLIINNTAGGYGAIDCFDESSPVIRNCTIIGNTGGGIHATPADLSIPKIRGCIFRDNGNDLDGATTTYSCLKDGNDIGIGNIYTDPIFKKGPYPDYGDYYLSQTAAGQLPPDSNCVNGITGDVNVIDPCFNTTRTDNVPDSCSIDMGFHYPGGIDVNYVLITGVAPSESFGTIGPNHPAPTGKLYKRFSEIIVDANPAPTYHVEKWTIDSNDINDVNSTRIITMDANHTVVVTFSSTILCNLTTFVINGNGSIDPYNAQPFVKYSTVDVNAHPQPGYVVKRWVDGNTATFNINDPCTYTESNDPNTTHKVTLLENTTAGVEFMTNPVEHLLTTSVVGGHGTLTPGRSYWPEGMIVQLIATPNPGYKVKQWTGADEASTALTNKVTMSGVKTVTVEFEPIPQYHLTIDINEPNLGGIVIQPNASGWYDFNTVVTLTAVPAEGRRVKGWGGAANNQPAWNINSNTVTMDANKIVSVAFEDNNSQTFYVFGDIYGIQKRLNDPNVKNGDTISIADGTYVGTGFTVNKVITIVGNPDNPENVIIDCNNQERYNGCMPVRSTGFDLYGNCTLNGITIINSHSRSLTCYPTNPQPGVTPPSTYDNYNGAIKIYGNSMVKNCIIRDCSIVINRGLNGFAGGDPNLGDPNGGNGANGADAGGAGIYVDWGDPCIMNVIIEDCYVIAGEAGDGNNGFYQIPGPNDPNYAPGTNGNGGRGGNAFGAGILIHGNSKARLTDVIVRNCTARAGNGGNGSNGIPGFSGLTPNDGGDGGLPGAVMGAGIFCDWGSAPVFVNCSVENCIGIGGRGGNGGNGGQTSVTANHGGYGGLTTNPAALQGNIKTITTMGGAVFCDNSSTATFKYCSFIGNNIYGSISGLGGISYLLGAEVQQEPRRNYLLAGLGAGAFCSTASSVKFNGCYFGDNRIAYNNDFLFDFNDPNLDPNAIPYEGEYLGDGGGLCLWYTLSSDINECYLSRNSAPLGGGIYSEGSATYINNSYIANNISISGGGVLTLNSFGTINKSTISGNIAGTLTGYYPDTGGALFGSGGGIYAVSSLIDINDTFVTENYARLTGGGIFFDGDTPFTQIPHIRNCLITANTTTDEGGGIAAVHFAEPKIQNCTIAENIVSGAGGNGGGLFASYAANVRVIDSIFWANSGVGGSQIALSSGGPFTDMPANVSVSYSDIDLREGTDFNSLVLEEGGGSGSPTGILVDSQAIYNEIVSSGSAKVIVSLVEPAEAQTVNWSSPASLSEWRSRVATLQNQVLSTLNTSEFTLRYKLTNMAVFSGQITQTGLSKLLNNPLTAHIEPVRTLYPMTAQGIPLMDALNTRGTYDGQGISIAIVDSGVDYTHPRLGGGGFPNSKVIGGYDFADNDSDPMPVESAHGTGCAGIAAGLLGTVGDYIGGVAPNAKIYAIRLGDTIPGFPSDYGLTAWDWCITHKNDDPANPILVISNSWRSNDWFSDTAAADERAPAYTLAAQRANSAGIAILASSGNEIQTDAISWPAAMSNVISVGAVYDAAFISLTCGVMTHPDEVTCYSNTADILDLLAPSENAYTTAMGGGYDQYFNGTSAACPYAAGAVAAVQNAAIQLRGHYLTPSQVRTLLRITGDSVTDTRAAVAITKPRVNLSSAIALLTPSTPIYVEENCTIIGVVRDANDTWIIDDNNNIFKDPNFVLGYYLSSTDALQDFNSPCINIGSDTAANLGLGTYTTRTDGVNDTGIVDLGYHYREGLARYKLRIETDTNDANGTVAAPYIPGHTYNVYTGSIVKLHAIPDVNARVAMWVLDGAELEIHDNYFNVTMSSDHNVVVRFEPYTPSNLIVPDEYADIQDAIDAASNGDTIYIYRKADGLPYYISGPNGFDFKGKAITIRSENPQDPNIVATTIIDCNSLGRAFIFQNGEDANSIIEGLTITNCLSAGAIAAPAYGDGANGNDATGDGYGGAIFVGRNAGPTIRYCVFSNCQATGGIASDGADGYDLFGDEDTRERGGNGGNGGTGYGNGYGGVFFCDQNSSPTISNCTISNCTARGGIGGNGGDGGTGTDNKIGGDGGNGGNGSGRGYGGVIYAAAEAKPKIIGCSFAENAALMGLGGAGGTQGPGNTPTEPPYAHDGFDGVSTGAGSAGVIYYKVGAKVDINDCNFINNTTDATATGLYDTGGGALYCEPNCAGISICKTNMSGNETTQGSGGAIKAGANNDITLIDCYFGGNIARSDGGALAIGAENDQNLCNLDFNNCAFTDNVAGNKGGAIMAANFDASLIDCYINRNTAESGGGLHLTSDKSTAKIYGGTIMRNKAIGVNAEGGGAYVSDLPLEIINCQIIGNTSLYSGGGIMLKGEGTGTSKVHNCLFTGNSASARGGALIILLHSSPIVSSCTFSENGAEPGGAGGGIFCSYNCSPIIKDCIFDQVKRVAIYENSLDSDPNISYCLFFNNADGDFYDRDSRLYNTYDADNLNDELAALNNATSGNNKAGNPNFITGDLGDYYLSQAIPSAPDDVNSPALDAGSELLAANVNVLPDDNMADYTTRIDSDDANLNAGDAGRLDIGFHYIDIEPNRPRKFELTTAVLGGHGGIEPPSGQYYAGTTIELIALPDPGWRVNEWTGTDDDSTTNTKNHVVMIRNRSVTVSFEQPTDLHVPVEYSSIQEAVNHAKNGDKIIIAKGTYVGEETNYDYTRIIVFGKNLIITGTNPDDPCIVAQTIIQGNSFAFVNVDSNTVLDGITIQDSHYYAGDIEADCGEDWAHGPTGDGYNGGSIFGGSIVLYNASPIIRNCRFVRCAAFASNGCDGQGDYGGGGWAGFARGGAAGIDSTSNPVFKNCQFIDCFAQGSNGQNGSGRWGHGGNWGDPNDDGWGSWDFGPYEEPYYYSGYGGAVYCMGGSKTEFEKCLFQGCRAYGGVSGVSGSVHIFGFPYENYAIDSFGGAVYLAAGSQAKFTDCNFVNNEAHTRGQLPGSDPNIPHTDTLGEEGLDPFLYDPVVSYGGAVCAEGTAIPSFKNCSFSGNSACAGGGMYWQDSTARISRSNFQNNIAMLGGAIVLADTNAALLECDFSGNQAIDPIGEGGAVYSASSKTKFYDCRINNNTASASGGGVYFSGEYEPNMFNCLVTYNTASRDGGGISANWDTQLTLLNCTVAHNAATGLGFMASYGGGLSCAYQANTKIINSIFWSNNAEYGPQISIGSDFDAADKLTANVSISYSDIEAGATGIFFDSEHGCTLDWGNVSNLNGTSLDSPLFISGDWGNFYLSQTIPSAPADVNSPCVDSGFETALNNNMYKHTTRIDHVIDIADSNVDMGYHYTLTAEILGDFNFDGIVDGADAALFYEFWMESGCDFPYFCYERDLTEDGEVDFEDFAAFAENYGERETTPPKPDPMTWAVRPRSTESSEITMTATTAKDNSGKKVYYYFECITDPNHNRNWGTSPIYLDSSVVEGRKYGYKVRAADSNDPNKMNITDWSLPGYAVAGEDDAPPLPDPMTWATPPQPNPASPSNSIRMVATTATDTSGPVEYYFKETSGNPGANDSGWQVSTLYEDFGLEPNTMYTYQVKARDNLPTPHETELSLPASATTLVQGEEPNEPNEPNEPPSDGTAPIPDPPYWVSVPQSIQDTTIPYFWRHYMTAVTCTDAESPPVKYFFDCISSSGTDSGWISTPTYVTPDPGYQSSNPSAYRFKTKDAAGNESGWSRTYDMINGYLD